VWLSRRPIGIIQAREREEDKRDGVLLEGEKREEKKRAAYFSHAVME
jgi:hypothetical protein